MGGIYYGLKECSKCEYNVRCQECIYNKTDISKLIAETRADTVREMQERLKEKLEHYPKRCGDCFKEKVDQIAKEMLEGL